MGTISIYGKNFLKTFLSKTGHHEPFLKIEKQITSIINMTTINNFSCNVTIYLTMYLTFILMKYVICLWFSKLYKKKDIFQHFFLSFFFHQYFIFMPCNVPFVVCSNICTVPNPYGLVVYLFYGFDELCCLNCGEET